MLTCLFCVYIFSKADTLLNKKTDLLVLYKIADDLLELFLKKYNYLQKYLLGIQIIQINAAVISSMQKLQDLGMNIDEWKTSDDAANTQQMIKQNLNDLIRKVRTWLYNVLPTFMVQHSYWQTGLLAHYASGWWEEKEFMVSITFLFIYSLLAGVPGVARESPISHSRPACLPLLLTGYEWYFLSLRGTPYWIVGHTPTLLCYP